MDRCSYCACIFNFAGWYLDRQRVKTATTKQNKGQQKGPNRKSTLNVPHYHGVNHGSDER